MTYGELFLQNEYEMSCYNLDEADVAEQRKRFALYEAEVSEATLAAHAADAAHGCCHHEYSCARLAPLTA